MEILVATMSRGEVGRSVGSGAARARACSVWAAAIRPTSARWSSVRFLRWPIAAASRASCCSAAAALVRLDSAGGVGVDPGVGLGAGRAGWADRRRGRLVDGRVAQRAAGQRRRTEQRPRQQLTAGQEQWGQDQWGAGLIDQGSARHGPTLSHRDEYAAQCGPKCQVCPRARRDSFDLHRRPRPSTTAQPQLLNPTGSKDLPCDSAGPTHARLNHARCRYEPRPDRCAAESDPGSLRPRARGRWS